MRTLRCFTCVRRCLWSWVVGFDDSRLSSWQQGNRKKNFKRPFLTCYVSTVWFDFEWFWHFSGVFFRCCFFLPILKKIIYCTVMIHGKNDFHTYAVQSEIGKKTGWIYFKDKFVLLLFVYFDMTCSKPINYKQLIESNRYTNKENDAPEHHHDNHALLSARIGIIASSAAADLKRVWYWKFLTF